LTKGEISMSRTRTSAILAPALLAGALALGACATHVRGAVYVPVAPPPPVVEVRPVVPGPGYVWIPGYHRWDGARYVWVRGRWELAPRGHAHWVPGHWRHDRRGWVWIPGHWR
jgi:hypothetical protein